MEKSRSVRGHRKGRRESHSVSRGLLGVPGPSLESTGSTGAGVIKGGTRETRSYEDPGRSM